MQATNANEACAMLSQAKPQLSQDQKVVWELSKLTPMDYDRVREAKAEELNIRVSTLDQLVRDAREKESTDAGVKEVAPWPEPVSPIELFNEISNTILKFIICRKETADTAALWIALTWFIDIVQVAPIATITAPEKRCGKSQLLFLIGKLCQRPLAASNISTAAIYRAIEAWKPTLLVDEADSFMQANEELRGIINSGHTRDTAYVIRIVGEEMVPKQFSTWGAKAIAGIGNRADTIMDRSIVLSLRRKLPNETVARLRHDRSGRFGELSQMLARFAEDSKSKVEAARPTLPENLNDRAQDNWEPLIAIADVVGGDWPSRARSAAVALSGEDNSTLTTGAELLNDIREIYEMPKWKALDSISSKELLEELVKNDEAPWATYNRGKEMSVRQLNRRLREFGIEPKQRRSINRQRQLIWEDFKDVWSRYLSQAPPENGVTVCQFNHSEDLSVTRTEVSRVTGAVPVTPNPLKPAECHAVTPKLPDGVKRYAPASGGEK